MSYGVGIVIVKDDLEKNEIRWDYCAWTLGISVKMYPEACRRNFKDDWYPSFKDEKKITTLDRLLTAPCDIVAVIDKEGNFETLKNRKPVDGTNIDLKDFLSGNKSPATVRPVRVKRRRRRQKQ